MQKTALQGLAWCAAAVQVQVHVQVCRRDHSPMLEARQPSPCFA